MTIKKGQVWTYTIKDRWYGVKATIMEIYSTKVRYSREPDMEFVIPTEDFLKEYKFDETQVIKDLLKNY